MKKEWLVKTLALGVVVLFFITTVSSTIGISNYLDDTTPPVTTISLDPPEPDGLNGWYVSDVTVTLNATDDLSGVKEIKYRINDDPIRTISGDYGTFLITEDSYEHTITYWAIDYAGNEERENYSQLKMDQTPPGVTITWEVVGGNWLYGWDLLLNAGGTDEISGIEKVEYYLNDVLQGIFTGPGPHEFGIKITPRRVFGLIRNLEITEEYVNFTAMLVIALGPPGFDIHIMVCAYDFAGNVDCDEWHLTPAIEPGIYLYKNLSLPNNYNGYIGKFFIFAIFIMRINL